MEETNEIESKSEGETVPAHVTHTISRTSVVVRIAYRCTNPKCKALDYGKYFTDENIAPIIQCFQCGNGRGMSVAEQLQGQNGPRGMVPFDEVTGKLLTSMHPTDNMPGSTNANTTKAVN